MKIHVSDPCKMLLDERYILEERTEGQELMDKVFNPIKKFITLAFFYLDQDVYCSFQFKLKYSANDFLLTISTSLKM